MNNLIPQFIAYTALFYLVYITLFKRLSFYQINRFVLLAIPVMAFCIPLTAPSLASNLNIEATNLALPEITIGEYNFSQAVEATTTTNWLNLLYYTVMFIILLSVLLGLVKGYLILRQSDNAGDYRRSIKVESPFTFFNSIIIPKSLENDTNLGLILEHEQVHVKQKHGIDNLYMSLLGAFIWFNPFVHLIAKELRQTHECLADEQALKNTSREEYAMLLLSSAFGKEIKLSPTAMGTASPFFNSSLIKTRIKMIYREKSKTWNMWSYLALIPLIAGMTIVSCSKGDSQSTDLKSSNEVFQANEVEQVPLFANCDANASSEEQTICFQQGIMKYIGDNFKYPKEAYELGIEGRIFVQFVINQAGEVEDAKVMRGLKFDDPTKMKAAEETNDYAIELVKSIPSMAPAMKDGKKVSMQFILPINLKMPTEES